MNLSNWKDALQSAILDPSVGIRIAPLTSEKEEFCLFVTEILPDKKVGAHYHQKGTEIYGILQGNGILKTASPIGGQRECQDIKSITVKAGDFFNINSGTVHQLKNTGDGPLILIFGCHSTHLTSDRILVDDLF
jgi:mannose-6-phosphate isomerase-like protein (cupin superfamily)